LSNLQFDFKNSAHTLACFGALNYKIANYQITKSRENLHLTGCVCFVLLTAMELRKDPITRSWVITGDDVNEPTQRSSACPFCGPSVEPMQVIANIAGVDGSAWSARSIVHPQALYHIEGEASRRGDGLYDRMGSVGAHEVLLENPHHEGHIWNVKDIDVEQFLRLAAQRIQDLKRDSRFKYISIFKNHGEAAGQEFNHPTSQLTATIFVPRRVLYELRAGREYFESKERCVFCDILAQEERQGLRIVETRGDYVAFCPYAPRVPYETWIIPRSHESSFERTGSSRVGSLTDLAGLLRRTLRRIRTVTEAFHLVLHTSPNSQHPSATLGYWKTLDDDYHWHIEILPIIEAKARSYTFKEVYYSPVTSETAVKRLRKAEI
jgi:UDPglucose--hexose-1-phosphate uridylyltransferase